MTNNINTRYTVSSPYEIDVTGDPATASVSVKVKATSSPPSGLKYLRIAVVEKEYVASNPFPNGTTRHLMSMLDMVPDALGTPINIAVGDSQTFNFNYNTNLTNLHPLQNLENLLTVVAFIQNDQNKEVLQAGYNEVGIETGIINSSAVIQVSETAILEGYVYNRSEGQMNLDLGLSGVIPSGWIISATSPQGNIPINSGSLTVNLPGLDSLRYTLSIDPQGNSGSISIDVNTSLTSNPSLSTSSKFYVTTNDINVLIVDAGIMEYGSILLNSLDSVYLGSKGMVTRDALKAPNLSLDNVNIILWTAGGSTKAFYQEEVAVLQNYLDNGGNLFITGQDIGNDIFGTNATSQHAQSFYNNYLHANFVSNASLFFLLYGVTGDLIGDGLRLIVSGIYDRSPDVIAPFDGQASSIFTYMTNPANIAGIRAAAGNYKVVYLGLGFEQITDAPNSVVGVKDSILARSIRWFEEGTVGIAGNDMTIHRFELAQNYPNPFNPETVIKYSLENRKAEQTTLLIFNSLGQVVCRLVDKPQAAGNYEVSWNARDDYGKPVASGVYYYQLKSAEKRAVQKMVLVR
ncbi:MAG: T9SS type A sorting domain-containing protein [bacterium]|nr:MAG: T9SS type A sorting domain-containing protein [bacterium]